MKNKIAMILFLFIFSIPVNINYARGPKPSKKTKRVIPAHSKRLFISLIKLAKMCKSVYRDEKEMKKR